MRQQYLSDGGPLYAETNFQQFIVEPWNAISSLAIVLPAIYWAIKLRWDFRNYPFLFYAIPLLILGGTGSTLYHAFRSSEFLLLMDVAPTALLTFSVGIYFWAKIFPKRWQTILVVGPAVGFRILVHQLLPGEFAINVGYFVTGTLIFLPILIFLIKMRFEDYQPILISVIMLSVSLIFRDLDISSKKIIPIGTHFLWHAFSGVGAYFLGLYLYRVRRKELRLKRIKS